MKLALYSKMDLLTPTLTGSPNLKFSEKIMQKKKNCSRSTRVQRLIKEIVGSIFDKNKIKKNRLLNYL